ncbi:isoprenoid synthase domain-containing protein, partial [Armillaria novae-zelandiae]
IVRSFLHRFDTTGLPSVNDAVLKDLCVKEGERRGYDLDALRPAMTVGLNITAAAYHHLSNVKVKVFIVFYTTFVTYLDDVYPDDPDALVGVNNFTKHFSASEKHSNKMLDDLANLLAETSQLFGQVPADLIVHAGLKFILGLVLERKNEDESVSVKFDMYALYLRELSGLGEAYAMFIFPAEVPDNIYIQALPIIRDFICFTNDITSFYKEECEGETHNLVSFLAEARGEPKNKALYYLVEKCMEAHERILLILSPHQEAQGMFKEFVKGFLSFHLGGKRYRLDELNL